MAAARYKAAAVGLNGKVYVMGGYNGIEPLAAAEVYDPLANRWRKVTPMPTARWSLGAGAINGKVYAVGGIGADRYAITEVYLP